MKHLQQFKNRLLTYCGFCTLSMFVCMPGSAWAIPIIDGYEPVVTNSYTTSFGYGGFASFDTVEFFIISDTGSSGFFEDPGSIVDGVTGSVINDSYTVANSIGSNGTGIIELFFTGDPIGILEVDMIAWSGSSVTNLTGKLTFSGGFLSGFSSLSCGVFEDCHNRSAVPEPSIVLLLCTGLLGIFGFARRKA